MGGIGLALAVSGCILGLTLLLPARQEGDQIGNELRQLESRLASAASPRKPAIDRRQQFEQFMSSLPRQDQINAHLVQLHELAASNHLQLSNGEYRNTISEGQRIANLRISVTTRGTYTDVCRFLQNLTAVSPALSLSRISLKRQKASDAVLEINVEFALFYTRAET